jgi:serine protease inhibitor
MPIRGSFTVKRSEYDNNAHLDFDLYDKIDNNNNIAYNNTTSGEFSSLDESMKTITRGVDPYETCINNINTSTCWLYNNLFMLSKNDFIINGFGLFSIFGVIYLISNNSIEHDLKNYFGYQDKRHLNAGLLTIREKLNNYRSQITIDNYIINNKDVPTDTSTSKKLKSLIFNLIVNKHNVQQETTRVNNIINTISNMENTMSRNTINKTNISLISIGKLVPIWAYKIDNIKHLRINNSVVNCLQFVGKTFNYYEDTQKQLIELPLYGDTYSIGIILSKHSLESPTDMKILNTAINYIKPTILDEVIVPMLNKRYKTRVNGMLKQTGLRSPFIENDIIGLYPEGGCITDYLQYTDVIFGSESGNKISQNKGYRTTRKFIANKSFEFYLRDIENNTLLMMGKI